MIDVKYREVTANGLEERGLGQMGYPAYFCLELNERDKVMKELAESPEEVYAILYAVKEYTGLLPRVLTRSTLVNQKYDYDQYLCAKEAFDNQGRDFVGCFVTREELPHEESN